MDIKDLRPGDVIEYDDVLDDSRAYSVKVRSFTVERVAGRNVFISSGDVLWWPKVKKGDPRRKAEADHA